MKLGDVIHPERGRFGKPLDGVRVLALEQQQALPYATQLLARLGADVVKVELPGDGESGRTTLPAMQDPWGRNVGCTYLRNNLGKRSVCIDLKSAEGRELILRLAPRFDVVAENFRGGTMTTSPRYIRRSSTSRCPASAIRHPRPTPDGPPTRR